MDFVCLLLLVLGLVVPYSCLANLLFGQTCGDILPEQTPPTAGPVILIPIKKPHPADISAAKDDGLAKSRENMAKIRAKIKADLEKNRARAKAEAIALQARKDKHNNRPWILHVKAVEAARLQAQRDAEPPPPPKKKTWPRLTRRVPTAPQTLKAPEPFIARHVVVAETGPVVEEKPETTQTVLETPAVPEQPPTPPISAVEQSYETPAPEQQTMYVPEVVEAVQQVPEQPQLPLLPTSSAVQQYQTALAEQQGAEWHESMQAAHQTTMPPPQDSGAVESRPDEEMVDESVVEPALPIEMQPPMPLAPTNNVVDSQPDEAMADEPRPDEAMADEPVAEAETQQQVQPAAPEWPIFLQAPARQQRGPARRGLRQRKADRSISAAAPAKKTAEEPQLFGETPEDVQQRWNITYNDASSQPTPTEQPVFSAPTAANASDSHSEREPAPEPEDAPEPVAASAEPTAAHDSIPPLSPAEEVDDGPRLFHKLPPEIQQGLDKSYEPPRYASPAGTPPWDPVKPNADPEPLATYEEPTATKEELERWTQPADKQTQQQLASTLANLSRFAQPTEQIHSVTSSAAYERETAPSPEPAEEPTSSYEEPSRYDETSFYSPYYVQGARKPPTPQTTTNAYDPYHSHNPHKPTQGAYSPYPAYKPSNGYKPATASGSSASYDHKPVADGATDPKLAFMAQVIEDNRHKQVADSAIDPSLRIMNQKTDDSRPSPNPLEHLTQHKSTSAIMSEATNTPYNHTTKPLKSGSSGFGSILQQSLSKKTERSDFDQFDALKYPKSPYFLESGETFTRTSLAFANGWMNTSKATMARIDEATCLPEHKRPKARCDQSSVSRDENTYEQRKEEWRKMLGNSKEMQNVCTIHDGATALLTMMEAWDDLSIPRKKKWERFNHYDVQKFAEQARMYKGQEEITEILQKAAEAECDWPESGMVFGKAHSAVDKLFGYVNQSDKKVAEERKSPL